MLRLLLLMCLVHLSVSYTISGNVIVNDDSSSMLPPGCQLDVQISDTTLADAPARVLGSAQYPSVSFFPMAYSLTYSPDIPPIPYYSMSARITCSGKLWFFSDTAVHVTVEVEGVSSADIPVRAIL